MILELKYKSLINFSEGQQIAHAMHMTNQASDLAYKADYKKDVLGKSTNDPAIAYPEHDRLKKIHDATNKAAYQKDSKAQNKHNVYPVDAMEFKRATTSAKNASDVSFFLIYLFMQAQSERS